MGQKKEELEVFELSNKLYVRQKKGDRRFLAEMVKPHCDITKTNRTFAHMFAAAPKTLKQRNDLMEVLLMLSRTARGISAAQHAEVEIGAEMWSSLDCLNIQAKNLIDLCKGE